jgi:hypothetical protein
VEGVATALSVGVSMSPQLESPQIRQIQSPADAEGSAAGGGWRGEGGVEVETEVDVGVVAKAFIVREVEARGLRSALLANTRRFFLRWGSEASRGNCSVNKLH